MEGAPLRILLSAPAARELAGAIAEVMQGRPHRLLSVDDPDAREADIAFVSRDVTGLSTKHETLPDTKRFYDTLEGAVALRWVHIHSAGADRPVYVRLRARGVQVSSSSGANALVVAHSALAGLLALARQLPRLWNAQREREWAPLIRSGMPHDLEGQTAVLVGWGPIGQHLGRMLQAIGLQLVVVRLRAEPAGPGIETVTFDRWHEVLPRADWLLLAGPLTERTRKLLDAAALQRLKPGAQLVNVSRGEIVDEPALIAALQQGRLAGAFLDVFAHEPLAPDSPLWTLPNVIATPHSAGFSDGNAARVSRMFLDNLRRWNAGERLHKLATD
jgi:phosphoglycerate dehydrogenase-like enzyme